MKSFWVIHLGLATFASIGFAFANPCAEDNSLSKLDQPSGFHKTSTKVLSSEMPLEVTLPGSTSNKNESLKRLFEIDLEVLVVNDHSSFLINVCRTKNCDDPPVEILSSFSFFPPPQVGTRRKFLFELERKIEGRRLENIYFSIENVGKQSSNRISLKINKIEEFSD